MFHSKALIIDYPHTDWLQFLVPRYRGVSNPLFPFFKFCLSSSQPFSPLSHSRNHRVDDKVTKPLRDMPPRRVALSGFPALPCSIMYLSFCVRPHSSPQSHAPNSLTHPPSSLTCHFNKLTCLHNNTVFAS